MKGLFIVIDGIDGSGKSAILKLLYNYLSSKNEYRIITTREPTDGVHGKKIRAMLKEEKDPDSNKDMLLDLFIKDREYHLKNTVNPFLDSGEDKIVLCDRYYYSTIAFQSAQGIPTKTLIEKNKDFRKPDLALILDISPEIALERISNRKRKLEKFEQLKFMENIRSNFLELNKHLEDNIKIIDSSKDIDEVFKLVKQEIDKLF